MKEIEVTVIMKKDKYRVFDNTKEYLEKVCFGGVTNAKARLMEFPLRKKELDGVTYYVDHTEYDVLMTKEVMEEVRSMCNTQYFINEKDVVPGKSLFCHISSDYDSVDELLKGIKEEGSFLSKTIRVLVLKLKI